MLYLVLAFTFQAVFATALMSLLVFSPYSQRVQAAIWIALVAISTLLFVFFLQGACL